MNHSSDLFFCGKLIKTFLDRGTNTLAWSSLKFNYLITLH